MFRPWSIAFVLLLLACAACSDDFESAPDAQQGGSAGAGGGTGGSGGGVGASGGTAGEAGSAGVGGSAGETVVSCPGGLEGPPMVAVRGMQGGGYCMDATEVTQQHYAKFLASVDPSALDKPPGCTDKLVHTPQLIDNIGCVSSAYNPAAAPQHPVVCIDWCDAWAYCAWAGKHLCGRVGGGSASYNSPQDPAESQWYNACSHNAERTYPYGTSYEPTSCNGLDLGKGATQPTGSSAECEGGFEGLFDMSGNVSEWEDSCDGTAANSNCRRRGGGFKGASLDLTCGVQKGNVRKSVWPDTGFRCCVN